MPVRARQTTLPGIEEPMNELKWELLTQSNGRLQADLLQSYLEAQGIEVELFQEAVGHHIYPVMIDGLGRVQIFVPKQQLAEAKELLAAYNSPEER
jgi:hypothetical protein